MSPSVLMLLGCMARNAAPRVESEGDRGRIDSDGLPVHDCSPPRDDSYISVLPSSYVVASYDIDSFSAQIDASTLIMPLEGQVAKWPGASNRDGPLPFESSFTLAIGAGSMQHPTDAQGEQTNDADRVYGDSPWFYVYGLHSWYDGVNWSGYSEGSRFSPSTLCLSRLRHRRIEGMFVYEGTNGSSADSGDAPFPLTYIFDFQASEPGETATEDKHDHLYTKSTDPSGYVRDFGHFVYSYTSDWPPVDLWTSEALPTEDSG